MNMSQRQRQSPASITSSTFRSSIPRTMDLPSDFDASYSPQVSDADMQHFALTSSHPRQQSFHSYMPEDYDGYFPGMGGTLSIPFSGTTVMNLTANPAGISPPESTLDCNEALLLRGFNGNPSPTYSSSELSSGLHYSTAMDYPATINSSYLDWQSQGLPSPPPESFVKAQLSGVDDLFMAPEEPTVCEFLGVSQVQAYRFAHPILEHRVGTKPVSKPRRSQPRPLRPSNERTESMDSTEDASSPRSGDDTMDKVKPRSDPLYDMKPAKDGFYHCPKKTESNCNHKPTKQRCIFA